MSPFLFGCQFMLVNLLIYSIFLFYRSFHLPLHSLRTLPASHRHCHSGNNERPAEPKRDIKLLL
ncbi:hypothetical protein ETC02_17545 [Geobacillus sp. DSP4a]|nr:hypothetical protein [Geobacillus sp. DSP4a]